MFGPYITRDIYTAYNSPFCYESTFEIESVKADDIGTAYVFVSNEKGHAGAQIQIQLAKEHHGTLGKFLAGHRSTGTEPHLTRNHSLTQTTASRFAPPGSSSPALRSLSSSLIAILGPLLALLSVARSTMVAFDTSAPHR